MTTYTITGITDNPDNTAYRCLAAPPTAITGVSNGDQVTLHYSAELGSVYGISPFLAGRPGQRLFVNPDSADCSGTTCTITGYNVNNESFTSANGTALVLATPDVGVTDLEPTLWASTTNWPTYANLNPGGVFTVPSKAELTTLTGQMSVVNGQVFSVLVNNAGPAASIGNLSKASIASILNGKYNVWGDVPEVGAGNATPIKLCRRDQGSGTQVAASVFFFGVECGRSTSGVATQALPGALTSVVENGTTAKVRSCVQGDTGAIGFASLSISANYKTLNIDGVQANAHNAAAGFYPFAFEDYVLNRAATTQPAVPGVNNIVAALITNARRAANIPAIEGGGVGANGQWAATGTFRANYALPGGGFGNTKSVASWASTAQATTALAYRSGDNCKVLVNDNTT